MGEKGKIRRKSNQFKWFNNWIKSSRVNRKNGREEIPKIKIYMIISQNWRKHIKVHFVQWTRKDPNLRCIIMELQNVRKKRKISKPSREEKNNLPVPQEVPNVKLSIAIWKARRQRSNMFKILRENYFQPRILYPDNPFKCAAKIKAFQTCKSEKTIYLSWTFSQESISGCIPPNQVSKTKRKIWVPGNKRPSKREI